MDNFVVNANLFLKAENHVCNSIEDLQGLSNLVDDVSTNFPRDYQYQLEVKDICHNIKTVSNSLQGFKHFLEDVKQQLNILDSSFEENQNNHESSHGSGSFGSNDESWTKSLGNAAVNTGSAWSKGFSDLLSGNGFSSLGEAFVQTGSTIIVTSTSVLSGVSKVGEYVADGVTFLGGSIVAGGTAVYDLFAGTDYAANVMDATLDQINRDLIREANQNFYDNTNIGQFINDNSNLKYDSSGAQAIQTGSEFAAKIAAATAATIVTGGAAAPIVVGTFYGAGKGVEKYTRNVDRDNGEQYNYEKSIAKGLTSGLSGALEWWGYGSMVSGIMETGAALNAMRSSGSIFSNGSARSIITDFIRDIPRINGRRFAREFVREFFSPRSILSTAAVVSDHGVNWYFGDETTEELLHQGGAELAFTTGLNLLGSSLTAGIRAIKYPDVNTERVRLALANQLSETTDNVVSVSTDDFFSSDNIK